MYFPHFYWMLCFLLPLSEIMCCPSLYVYTNVLCMWTHTENIYALVSAAQKPLFYIFIITVAFRSHLHYSSFMALIKFWILLHFQLPSYPLIPQNQVPSSHLLDPPVSDCLTSCHVSNPPETPTHMAAELQATPPQQFNLVQELSPHLLLSQITPPHLNQPQMTSPVCPHPYVASSLGQQPELICPQFAAQPQLSSLLLSPPHQVYNQNHDSDWNRRAELSYHQGSENTLYQVRYCPSPGMGGKKQKCFESNSSRWIYVT